MDRVLAQDAHSDAWPSPVGLSAEESVFATLDWEPCLCLETSTTFVPSTGSTGKGSFVGTWHHLKSRLEDMEAPEIP